MIDRWEMQTVGEKAFKIFNTMLMLFVILITLYPFWYCIVGSFNNGADYLRGGVDWWPRKFTLANYVAVFSDNTIVNAYIISALRTVIGTFAHVLFTGIFAYGFSRRQLKGRNFYAIVGLLTMYLNGGLIPQYILYSKLGLLDSFGVYIFPLLLNFYHVIIMQSFFRTIPESINESAKIDGATEYRIFFSLILPLSKPVLAAISLFIGVKHWNSYYDSLVFTRSDHLQTIQVYLMKIIKFQNMANALSEGGRDIIDDFQDVNGETVKLATMMATTLPIMVMYPFLQKYFTKGIMVGSVKG